MNTWKKMVLAGLVSTAAMAAGAVTVADLKAQGLQPLNNEEIKVLITGQTLDHKMAGARSVAPIHYRADGTRTVNATALGGRMYDTKWWVEDNQRCEISARTNAQQCGVTFKRAEEYVFCITGEEVCGWTFTVRPGNPDGLGK